MKKFLVSMRNFIVFMETGCDKFSQVEMKPFAENSPVVKAPCCILWPRFNSRRTHLDFRMNHAYLFIRQHEIKGP